MFGAVSRRRAVSAVLALCAAVAVIGVAEPSAMAGAIHHPIGRLAGARFVGGVGLVSGWTLDLDTVAPLRVTVTVDGAARTTVVANAWNAAVALQWPSYHADHGFSVALALPDRSHQVCALAHNVGLGHDQLLGCKAIVAANDPVGALTGLNLVPGAVRLAGWSLDPNTAAPITVRALIDGKVFANRSANVSSTLPAPPAAAGHGFSFDLSGLPAGPHDVCAQGVNVGMGKDATLGCRTITVTDNPVGALATITR